MQFILLSCHWLVSVRTAAHSNVRTKAGCPSSSSDGPKRQEDVGLDGALWGLFRGRILEHVVLSDGTRGVIGRDTWCHRTGHVSSDGTRGVVGRDTWCHRTGHVVSSDGTRGVMRRDMWFHRTGHVVSSDGTRGVIRLGHALAQLD
jgi:hypothetical protein